MECSDRTVLWSGLDGFVRHRAQAPPDRRAPKVPHDGRYHIRWWQNFSDQVWRGEWYPRWLLNLNDGAGSPAFFYYPPLPFWMASLFRPFVPETAGAVQALGLASVLALLMSGWAAWACFRRTTVSHWRPLLGAAVYMAMPYHWAIDALARGAYAEVWSFVWMPLALAGILQQAAGNRLGWLKASLGLGLLFLTHLPTSVTFTPLLLLFAFCYGLRVFGATLAAAAFGSGLAAIYVLPALAMQDAAAVGGAGFSLSCRVVGITGRN